MYKASPYPTFHQRPADLAGQSNQRVDRPRSTGTPAGRAGNPRRIVDSVSYYRMQTATYPLLSRDEERKLAREIYCYRLAFQRRVMRQPEVVEYLLSLIQSWRDGQYRIDRLCNLALNSREARQSIEPRLAVHEATVRSLLQQRQQRQQQSDHRGQRRLENKIIRLLEELSIRPERLEESPYSGRLAERLLERYQQRCREMAAANLRLVFAVAHQICGSRPILSDMLQEGNRGLMRAVVKFDHRRDLRFSTYATLWIRQAILNAIGNIDRNIQLPSNFNSALHRVRRETISHAAPPQASEIAESARVSIQDADRLLRVLQDTQSLDETQQHPEGTTTLANLIADDRPAPYQSAQANEQSEHIYRSLRHLTPRQRQVIELRFGLVDSVDRSMAEVGRVIGITRERVRQIYNEALAQLEQQLGLPPPAEE